MRLQGKICTWNDERGYGFVEWNGGPERAFVHVSAIAGSGRRPVVGDVVTYRVRKDGQGRSQAVDVEYVGRRSHRVAHRRAQHSAGRSILFAILMLGGLVFLLKGMPTLTNAMLAIPSSAPKPVAERDGASEAAFRCEGKSRCSEMASCDEAVFYLEHCPGTKMDGDGDGRPCEDWCGH